MKGQGTVNRILNRRRNRLLDAYARIRRRFLSHPWIGLLLRGRRTVIGSAQYHRWIREKEPSGWAPERVRALLAGFDRKLRISILMPVFNTPPAFLQKAIQSVKTQIYENWGAVHLRRCQHRAAGAHLLESVRRARPAYQN